MNRLAKILTLALIPMWELDGRGLDWLSSDSPTPRVRLASAGWLVLYVETIRRVPPRRLVKRLDQRHCT